MQPADGVDDVGVIRRLQRLHHLDGLRDTCRIAVIVVSDQGAEVVENEQVSCSCGLQPLVDVDRFLIPAGLLEAQRERGG